MTEIEHIGSESHEVPKYWTYWMLVGRYTAGCGQWFGTGTLHRDESGAVGDLQNWGYAESKLVKIRLPNDVSEQPESHTNS